MNKILILLAVVIFISCGKDTRITQKEDNPKKEDKRPIDVKDTKPRTDIEYTVISTGKHLEWVFGDGYKPWTPSNEDISYAFKKIDTCFYDQKRGTVNRLLDMKPEDYCMQFVGGLNTKGERLLWVNCFCKSQVKIFTNWKEDLVEVEDGGKCFFNVRFNLDRPDEPYILKVNGNA